MKRHVKRETAIKHLRVSRAPFPYSDPPQYNNNHRHRLLFQLNKKAVDSAVEVWVATSEGNFSQSALCSVCASITSRPFRRV